MVYLEKRYCYAGRTIQIDPAIHKETVAFCKRNPRLKAYSGWRHETQGDHRCGRAIDFVPDNGIGPDGYGAVMKGFLDAKKHQAAYVEPLAATWIPGNHHLHISFKRCAAGVAVEEETVNVPNPVGGSTPSITPAQIVAAIGAVLTQLLNAALISGRIEHLIVGISGTVIPLGWILADAIIRHARNKTAQAQIQAAATVSAASIAPGDRQRGVPLVASNTFETGEHAGPVTAAPREPSVHVPRRRTADDHPILKAFGTFDGLALGKHEPVHDPRTPTLGEYLMLAAPGAPALKLPKLPKRVHRLDAMAALIGGDFGMMGNAAHGDCTCAALGHLEQGWTAGNTDTETFTPTEDQVLDLYWKTGSPPSPGADDNGRVMFAVLKHAKNDGLFGRKIGAYVAVGLHRYGHRDIKAAIDLFGGCYIGVALPETAQGQPVWDVAGDPTKPGPAQRYSWGGHAISLHDYDEHGATCITWGHPQKMTWAFLDAYADEAYAIIADDWLAGGKTIEGFDAAALQADLQRIRAGWQPPQ